MVDGEEQQQDEQIDSDRQRHAGDPAAERLALVKRGEAIGGQGLKLLLVGLCVAVGPTLAGGELNRE